MGGINHQKIGGLLLLYQHYIGFAQKQYSTPMATPHRTPAIADGRAATGPTVLAFGADGGSPVAKPRQGEMAGLVDH